MLKCNKDGNFKILVIADPQCESDFQWQESADEIETLVKKANPDIVIINGDMETNNNVSRAGWDTLIKPLTERGICWATTNGNHDPFDAKIHKIYESYAECLNEKLSEENANFEAERPLNYQIPIYANTGEKIVFAIYGMDSGARNNAGWEGFTEKQIKWYTEKSEELKALNENKPVTSLLCCHIPFTEIVDMQVLHGVIHEEVSATAPENNKGIFESIKKQGDVKIAVFGHSHQINRVGIYENVILAYAGKISSGSYHDKLTKGGRLIEFNQSNPEKFTTSWIPALPTSVEQPKVCLYDIANEK